MDTLSSRATEEPMLMSASIALTTTVSTIECTGNS